MKKVLITLMLILSLCEAIIMYALGLLMVFDLGVWPLAFLNALFLALTAILVIELVLKHSFFFLGPNINKGRLSLQIGTIIFSLEIMIMIGFYLLPTPLKLWQMTLIDILLLLLLAPVIIYLIVFNPAMTYASNKVEPKAIRHSVFLTNLTSYIGLLMLILLLMLAVYKTQYLAVKTQIVNEERQEIKLASSVLSEDIRLSALDVLTRSTKQSLQMLLMGEEKRLTEIQKDYIHLSEIKEFYQQARVLNRVGKEIIRVERTGDKVKQVPFVELQDKGDRYYFQKGMTVEPGHIYISPLDLNVEQGQVEVPFRPVIRFVAPVGNNSNETIGVVVFNYDGSKLLSLLEQSEGVTTGELMLVNSDGYWLYGGKEENLWAFMFPERPGLRLPDLYPDIWEEIEQNRNGATQTSNGLFIYEQFKYFPHQQNQLSNLLVNWPNWYVISRIPPTLVSDQLSRLRYIFISLFLLMAILGGITMVILTDAICKGKEAEQEVRYLALYDSLTGLSNRSLFYDRLKTEINATARYPHQLALLYLDLDHFKPINDELGHKAGDQVLKEVANRLRKNLRSADTAARLGGDEFAVICPRSGDRHNLSAIAQRLLDAFAEPFHIEYHERRLSVSIGISILPLDNPDMDSLIQQADEAMYQAKKDGRNCFRFAS